MKHFNYYFILMALAFVGFTSCSDDDEPKLTAPGAATVTVTASPEAIEGTYFPGTVITYTVVAEPVEGSKLLSLEIVADPASEDGSTGKEHLYVGSEPVEYEYTVPVDGSGTTNILFTVIAVNPEDISLETPANNEVVFDVQQGFYEYTNIRLNNYNNGDLDSKSMLRFDTGETFSVQETIDGDDAVKLGIDIYPFISGTGAFYFLTPPQILPFAPNLPALWPGDYVDNAPKSAYIPNVFSVSEFDFDDADLTGADIMGNPGKFIANPAPGTVIAFDNTTMGQPFNTTEENPEGEHFNRGVTDVVGLIKIVEVNQGTVGDGSDAYIIIDIKVAKK